MKINKRIEHILREHAVKQLSLTNSRIFPVSLLEVQGQSVTVPIAVWLHQLEPENELKLIFDNEYTLKIRIFRHCHFERKHMKIWGLELVQNQEI